MPKVSHYKHFDKSEVALTIPEKSKEKYISYFSDLSGDSIYVQTPVLHVVEKYDKGSSVNLSAKGALQKLLKDLQEHCIDHITKNSQTFFKGKRFSREKIANSFV